MGARSCAQLRAPTPRCRRRRGVGVRSCAQLRAPTPRRRRRRGVGVRNCAPGGLRGVVRGSTMCCAQVQIQVDYAAELDDVGEKREPGAG